MNDYEYDNLKCGDIVTETIADGHYVTYIIHGHTYFDEDTQFSYKATILYVESIDESPYKIGDRLSTFRIFASHMKKV